MLINFLRGREGESTLALFLDAFFMFFFSVPILLLTGIRIGVILENDGITFCFDQHNEGLYYTFYYLEILLWLALLIMAHFALIAPWPALLIFIYSLWHSPEKTILPLEEDETN